MFVFRLAPLCQLRSSAAGPRLKANEVRAVIIEGVTFAAFPQAMRRAMEAALEHSENLLRITGLSVAVAGLLLIWFMRYGM